MFGVEDVTCDDCCEGIVECNLCAKSNCGNCVNKLSEYKKKNFGSGITTAITQPGPMERKMKPTLI